VVRGKVRVSWEELFGNGACGVLVIEQPLFNAFSIISYARYGRNGVPHDLEGYGADEVLRHFDFLHAKPKTG